MHINTPFLILKVTHLSLSPCAHLAFDGEILLFAKDLGISGLFSFNESAKEIQLAKIKSFRL